MNANRLSCMFDLLSERIHLLYRHRPSHLQQHYITGLERSTIYDCFFRIHRLISVAVFLLWCDLQRDCVFSKSRNKLMSPLCGVM